MFPRSSRYYGIDSAVYVTSKGKEMAYLRRRFLPDPSSLTVFTYHTVFQGERLDNIAARYLGDPELFWKICDGNNALRPDGLTEETGSKILIPMPKVG